MFAYICYILLQNETNPIPRKLLCLKIFRYEFMVLQAVRMFYDCKELILWGLPGEGRITVFQVVHLL